MAKSKDYNKTSVLVVGAGPSGLAAAITLKKTRPETEVCVVDKAAAAGYHCLSGAVLEPKAIGDLLDLAVEDWAETDRARDVFANKVSRDNIMFFWGRKLAFPISCALKAAKMFGLGAGQMLHKDDYIVSISKLTAWLSDIAREAGVEVIYGFGVEDILYDDATGLTTGVKLVDQGLDRESDQQQNYVAGETITADVIVLAEGCDGLLTEKFIEKAGLERQSEPLYSVGVKEIIQVSDKQYARFGDNRVIHAMGYPLWSPVIGPGMFGSGIMYPMGDNRIGIGMTVGLDWKYCDFNPQDALTLFKEHAFVKKFIDGGEVAEAGAKMIPGGGYYAIPRDPKTGAIGKGNVVIVGDSAGLVNMLKIKGLHNAIESGMQAGQAIANNFGYPSATAGTYTKQLDDSCVMKEMESTKNFRHVIAKLGPLQGMSLSVLGGLLPKFNVEKDYEAMTARKYRPKPDVNFDKDAFTAVSAAEHRKKEPSHLTIGDSSICQKQCTPKLDSPCITFCPAGVYEMVREQVKPANPSNCLHCKMCQRKCPFDNIRWTMPEGGGGPRYRTM